MKQLSDVELQEFKDRALQAATYGYEIALADDYMAALASESGQEVVPEGATKGSAAHLLSLAEEVLALRASGGKDPSKAQKEAALREAALKEAEEAIKAAKAEGKLEPKVEAPEKEAAPEPAKVEAPKAEETAEPVKEPVVEAKNDSTEAPKEEPKKSAAPANKKK
jgi:colicin import membrane protein